MNGQYKQGKRKFIFFCHLHTDEDYRTSLFSLSAATEIRLYFFNTTAVKQQSKWGTTRQVVQAVIQE